MQYIAGCIILIAIDQISKYLIYDHGMGADIFFTVLNTGAARSIGIHPMIIFFVGLAVTIRLIHSSRSGDTPKRVVALFVAGIRGNLIDRRTHGGVRDFIHIADRYPIFNIADIYITSAALRLIASALPTKSAPSSGQDQTNP